MTSPPPGEGRADEQGPEPPAGADWPAGWPGGLTVPDDISTLAADVELWQREQRADARRRRVERLLGGRAWRSYGISAPMVVAGLLLVGLFGALLMLFGPRAAPVSDLAPVPLADPAQPPGTVGGLLPALALRTPGGAAQPTRNLARPAALVLIPAGCACATAIDHALDAAGAFTLHQYVVTATASEGRHYAAYDTRAVVALVDPEQALQGGYGGSTNAPTVVVEAADGVVRSVIPGVTETTALAMSLRAATGPVAEPAPSSTR